MARYQLRQDIPNAKTIVVKVGSRILTAENNLERSKRVRTLVTDIVALRETGHNVVLVSSGAIAHGVIALELKKRPATIRLKQACASVGQIRLMHMYDSLFAKFGIHVGQVLLSKDDLRDKQRYLNLRNTLFELLDSGVVPVINENDSVGVDEIKFGDNDTLGAQIAMLVGSDLYVILTDIDGLYDANPQTNPSANHIPVVKKITRATHKLAGDAGSDLAVGGMSTKLKAAEMVARAGVQAIIGDGFRGRLSDVLRVDGKGTVFLPAPSKMTSHHRWIAFAGDVKGSVSVDSGAKSAIQKRGKSLLPAGARMVSGTFRMGDMIDINDERGKTFARGIANYSAGDTGKICGIRSSDIQAVLGQKTHNALVHRDNLVLL